jgi:hypothetical protein
VRRFAPRLFAQLFCISLLLCFGSNSQGQIPGRPSSQQQVQDREWSLENLRKGAQVRPQPYSHEKVLAQKLALKNDFRQLQIVNNSLMVRMFQAPPTEKITNKEIRSSLGEIKKIAERLQYNFRLPKVKQVESANDIALTPGLLELDKAVMSFVENPWFQQPGTYDTELSTRAGNDLGEVLRLVDVLRKLTKKN